MYPAILAAEDTSASLRNRLRLVEETSLACLHGGRETIAQSRALLLCSAQRIERIA